MATILKFDIRTNYRDPIDVDSDKSVFKGRDELIQKFKNVILNRKAACVLIGGARGIGKTSFVKEVLRQIKHSKNKKSLIVLEATLASIAKGGSIRKKVLNSLTRSLYLTLNKSKWKGVKSNTKDILEGLYQKSYYSEFKDKNMSELVKKQSSYHEEKETQETIIKWDIGSSVKLFLKWLSGGFGFWLLADMLTRFYPNPNPWVMIILFLIGAAFILILLNVNLNFTFTNGSVEGEESGIDKKTGKTGIAKYDLSSDTIEFGLNQVLVELNKDYKVVFVIDELDKLDSAEELNEDAVATHTIYKVVKSLKNLFTLSNSIFVFVGSDDFFHILENKRKTDPYSNVYTLFTDRLFLSPMYYADIKDIVMSYVKGHIAEEYAKSFSKFISFVSWQAKNHIFDTHNLIENFINFNKDETPSVKVYSAEGLSKGNIPEDWETCAALQVFLNASYDEKLYPGEYETNEKLYLVMREVCGILQSNKSIEIKEDDFLGILPKDIQKRLRLDDLDEASRQDFAGAIEDFLLRAERNEMYGIIDSKEEKRKATDKDGKELETSVCIYSLKDKFSFPDLESVRLKTLKTKYEEGFLDWFEKLDKTKSQIDSSGLSSFKEYVDEHTMYLALANKIKKEKPRAERKSQVQNYSERIEDILYNLRNKVFFEITTKVVEENSDSSAHSMEENVGGIMWDLDPKLAPFYHFIEEHYDFKDRYTLIEKNGVHILVGFDFDQEDQDEYIKIGFNDRKYSVCSVVNIVSDKNLNKAKQWKWRTLEISETLQNLNSLKRELSLRLK
ncbi:ATP-binding protein [Patescibacteria group bacterium]|nr:ATP-binding protein [Patescibacteria group bacterium]